MVETLLNTKKSQELYERACELIPGGVNSPVRAFKAVGGNPLFISKADGEYIWDVDGNKYIDFVNSWGALIGGHRNPSSIDAVQEALEKGISYGASHENEIQLAEKIISKFPSIEKIRLVSSGTEAVMTALRLARAYTKKNKIIKFSGCYHGHSDSVLTSCGSGIATLGIPMCEGINKNIAADTITLPYNDISALEITLTKYPNEIAGIILEPVVGNSGLIKPKEGYLKFLEDVSKKYKCLLILDEVITGFRVSLGGAQEKYKINPHITTLGKIIGGGLPVAAVGGKKEIMDLLSPCGNVYQAGTLSGNPVAVACGLGIINSLNEKIYNGFDELLIILSDGINEINKKNNIQAQFAYETGMFSIFFNESPVHDFESAKKSNTELYSKFFHNMLANGIYLPPSQFEACFLSTSHSKESINKFLQAYKLSTNMICA